MPKDRQPVVGRRRPKHGRLVPVDTGVDFVALGNHIKPDQLAEFLGDSRDRVLRLAKDGARDEVVENLHLAHMLLIHGGLMDPSGTQFTVDFEIRGAQKANLKGGLRTTTKIPLGDIFLPDLNKRMQGVDLAVQAVEESADQPALLDARSARVSKLEEHFPDLSSRPYLRMILGLTR